ncbi:unnamed protein product [Leuciscus chuanchicus]
MSGEEYEFYNSVELDDIQMSLCNSVNKADFMTRLCEESERLFNESDDLHYKQQWLQINIKTLMDKRNENSTRDTDLHVLQWRHGCAVERHSNGSVMFLQGTDEYAYDGQTLTFDLSMHWKPLVLDHDIIWDRESVSSLERKCVETLTRFTELQREGKIIMESRPDVHTLVKASGSSVSSLLVCLATGFYPKHVQMEIRHDQTPVPDDQLNSEGIRPNADGSFQLKKSLEILPSERSQYQCVVKHQTLTEPLIIRCGPERCAAALNTDPEEENPTDPSVEEVHTEEVHDTQSLCETEVTPEAARGAMGSKNFSLPNFEMHSLYYTYSAVSKPLMSGEEYEFYNSVELDDIQMSLCNSVNKADFMTRLCEESERLFNESDDLHYKQQWLQINIKTLMDKRNENSTRDTDLHVLQWRHGCAVERHSNGSVMFLQGTDEYAYDGQTLTFDLSMHWKPLVLDHDIIWDRESVSSLERKCVETLTRFTELQREGKIIMESRPRVHTLVKASGSSVSSLLVCLATGFYPKHVQMEIRHDQTPVPDDQLNSEGIRPNADGSFQLKKSLEILPSERSQYQCVVKHQTLTEPLIIRCGNRIIHQMNVRLRVVTGFIVALFVLVIILLVFYLLRKCVKRRKLWEEMSESELLKRPERCAAALNTDPEEENPTDPSVEEVHSEEVHDTQSLCETEATPEAARGAMGSKNFSLPNLAMEREDTDQNTITQNALLLPLPSNVIVSD